MITDFWHKLPKLFRWLIIAAPVVIIFILIGFATHDHIVLTATVELSFTPSSATATLNGKTYKNGEHKIKPGKYDVKIQKDGFASYSGSFTVKANENQYVGVALKSNSAKTADYYDNNMDDAMRREGINDRRANAEAVDQLKKYPIIKILPLIVSEYTGNYSEYIEYRIDYGNSPTKAGSLAIFITDKTGGNEQRAKDLLRSKGYNPDDYEIIYKYEPVNNL